MSAKSLLILGAGQFGIMVKELALESGEYSRIDFLDDVAPFALGKMCDCRKFATDYPNACVAIGDPTIRERLFSELYEAGFNLVNIIGRNTYISPSAVLGKGIIIEPMATVQKCARVGDGCIVSSGAVLRHDSCLEPFCHCDCNSVVMSNSTVPKGTKIPCLTVFKNN